MSGPKRPGMLLALRAALINIPRKVGERAWVECLDKAMDRGSIVGVNEALSEQQRRAYRGVAAERGYSVAGLVDGPNPVFWDRLVWRHVRSRVRRLHPAARGPLAKRFPGYNAARYVTVAALEHRATGRRVTVLCFHLAVGGPDKVSVLWHKAAVAASIVKLARIATWHAVRGRPVILMGDTNARVLRLPARRFRWVADGGRIDKIGATLPARVALVEQAAGVFAAPTDHKHGVYADLTLHYR